MFISQKSPVKLTENKNRRAAGLPGPPKNVLRQPF